MPQPTIILTFRLYLLPYNALLGSREFAAGSTHAGTGNHIFPHCKSMKNMQEPQANIQRSISAEVTEEAHGLPLPAGTKLQGYRLLRKIGQGGCGITYLAEHEQSHEQVVIKENVPLFCVYRDPATHTLHPLKDDDDSKANYAHTIKRFMEEAQLLSRLNHPNIVRVREAFEALGTAYYVMPYIEAKDLHKAAPATVDEAWLLPILQTILTALQYLHGEKLLHRDLKPGNILLQKDGTPILIDFGTARALQTEYSVTMAGTPGYAPIEQITPHSHRGPWTDIYALGATCYLLITRSMPPGASERTEGKDPYAPLATRPKLLKRFSSTVLKSIDKALAPRARHRWQTAQEWMDALAPSQASCSYKRRIAVATAAAALLALTGWGIYALTGSNTDEATPAPTPEQVQTVNHKAACAEYQSQVLEVCSKSIFPKATDFPRLPNEQIIPLLQEAATAGTPEVQFVLSIMLEHGLGMAKNPAKAAEWCTKAAEQRFALAQCHLGGRYEKGNGVVKNIEEAVKWYQLAAEQGLALAQFNLGACYMDGTGVPQDYTEAAKWFKLAAEQGFVIAQTNLGAYYASGIGVAQNYSEAVKWYKLAAEQGYKHAQFNLGVCYDQGTGVPQDGAEAAKWFRLAAEQGLNLAQANLGTCYYHGKGVPQDYTEAIKWYKLAAEQGLSYAQFNLGLCYDQGIGAPQDYAEAIKWFRLAAQQGHADALYFLGIYYVEGTVVPQDYTEAVKWFKLAAEQDHAGAQFNVGVSYFKGNGVPQDYTEAVKWFRLAAEQGHADAQHNLGVCYEKELGVEKDTAHALEWYRKAAQQGNNAAYEALRRLQQQEQ